jgi:tetratricopeptide (TPR) repeat protein
MNWFTNLFKKKKSEKTIYNDDLEWDIFIHFGRGKKYFLEEKWAEALYHLDEALGLGYKKNDIHEIRGYCLQALEYPFDAIEDFNKSILFYPNDCNLYFTRAILKKEIFDYEGEINDLEKAIELSGIINDLNENYNEIAIKNGYCDGLKGLNSMYRMVLFGAKSRLISNLEKINNEQLILIKKR